MSEPSLFDEPDRDGATPQRHAPKTPSVSRALLATVPAVISLSSDPAQARGQLLATRLVLQETLSRLPDDRLAELKSTLGTLVAGLREVQGAHAPPEQAHIIDELEALTLRLRYLDQPVELPDADARAGDRAYTAVCMRCEHFPINIGPTCPQCQTDRWVIVVRS